ncbi:MAG TPA: hypothetical protein VI997_11775 [Candidatus Thermoplasmatota archaeon]|nr:hypothetical protein [Candidatus Thermoplasmatota archaeon]
MYLRFVACSVALVLAAPAVAEAFYQAETVAPGAYRAYRMNVFATTVVSAYARYDGVVSDQPVLPVLGMIETVDRPFVSWAAFAYHEPRGDATIVHAAGWRTEERTGGPICCPYETGFVVPPGEYRLLLATAPADGAAAVVVAANRTIGLVPTESGTSGFFRPFDKAAAGADVERADGTRAWVHGAYVDQVEATRGFYGYAGYRDGPPRIVSPNGNLHAGLVWRGEPGTWTFAFGPDAHAGTRCPPPLFCPREDPTFVLWVDVPAFSAS